MKPPSEKQPRNRILTGIAIFKFVKALLFLAVALGAFEMLRPSFAAKVQSWAADLPFEMEQHLAEQTLDRIFRLGVGGVVAAGVGALLYAGLFITEGVGLLRQRRWAEWLTVIATSSLVPLEIWECIREITVIRVAALALNLAIVWYLVLQLRHRENRATS